MVYKARSKRFSLVLLSAILLISLSASSACGCIVDKFSHIWVDNRTDQTLDISIEGDYFPLTDAPPGEVTEFVTSVIDTVDIYPDKKFLIEAKTKDGEVVYSEEFTWQELDDMDWTIVIPSPAAS